LIWLLVILLAALALAPLAWVVSRRIDIRGRRDAAMALHRAQLAELDHDFANGRLLPEELAAAKLEVQRRLLADAALPDDTPKPPGRIALLITAAAIPVAALALYLTGGHPYYRAEERAADAQAATQQSGPNAETEQQAEQAVGQLRARLAIMDPGSDGAREGYILLGRTELSLNHLPEAADAWEHALAIRFDPTLAATTAELMTEAEGRMSDQAAALFKRALAEAPPDVPWRKAVEARLSRPAAP
jgi:cytochrome c-type biogenesis protein CcmH